MIAPPLRETEDCEALWMAVRGGEIQTISTDHCSFTTEQKALGKEDFRKIPGGLPGVESRGILLYTSGVKTGKISVSDMCRLLSENPAKLYGMYPRKGCLKPGSDADLVILDPEHGYILNKENLAANVDYQPYDGYKTACTIEKVYLRGQLVAENGKVLTSPVGTYIERSIYEE